jgi:N utilization substance protein A
VEINNEEKAATVIVPDTQLSLAIGKEGQNARLAAKLTGWHIDIKSLSAAEAERELEITQPELRGNEAILEPEVQQVALPLGEVEEAPPVEMATEVKAEVLPAQQEAELSAEVASPVLDSSLGETPLEAADKRIRFAEELLTSRNFKCDAKVKMGKKRGVGRARRQLEDIEEEDY